MTRTSHRSGARKSHRINVAMSAELYTLLKHTSERRQDGSLAETVRQAIRNMVDVQADVAGSRRHFTRSLEARFDQLDRAMATQRREVLAYLMTAVYTVTWLVSKVLLSLPTSDYPETIEVHKHWRQGIHLMEQHAEPLFEDMQQLIDRVFGDGQDG